MPAAKRTAPKAKTSAKTKPASAATKARSSRKAGAKATAAPKGKAKPAVKPAVKPAAKPAKKKPTTKPVKAAAASRAPAKAVPKTKAQPSTQTSPRKAATKAHIKPSRAKAESYEYDPNALIHGIRPYKPKAGEGYMNDAQLEHFRQVLLAWKRELMEEVDRTVHHMQDEASNFPDPNDRATQESEFGLELRTRDRERKLLKKISSALARIDEDSYGYCEETGEEIGLKRLEARPVATLCLEAQERRELAERQYGERDDRHR